MSHQRAGGPTSSRALGWVVLLFVALIALPAILHLTSASTYPVVAPRPAALAPLTRRLVLVVIDGLRYDFATDPDRAPSFARRMREHSSAEVWAGRVTMTSEAVLLFGTAARGNLSRVVLNVKVNRTTANHVLQNARAQGLTTGLLGDPVWEQAYGGFDREWLSREDLALDVDDSPLLFAEAQRWLAAGTWPNLTIVHVFANDHLSHAFGPFSPRYREFLRQLDGNLEKMLDELPDDVTVVALSDHGALTNGNHGMGTDTERKTPLFAYGPGIRSGQRLTLQQEDVAPTLAALLGVASPAHGVGKPATQLLALEADATSRLACAELERFASLAQASQGAEFLAAGRADLDVCQSATSTEQRIAALERVAQSWDQDIERREAARGLRGWVQSSLAVVLFGLLLPLGAGLRRRGVRAALALAACSAWAVGITGFVDHAARPWNDTRAAVMWLATLALTALLAVPAWAERVYARWPFTALAVAPGLLFASFPTNTHLHCALALIAAVIASALAAWRGGLARARALVAIGAAVIGAVVGLRLGSVTADPISSLVPGKELWLGVGLLLLWLVVLAVLEQARGTWLDVGLGAASIGAALGLRHALPATVGLALMALLLVAAAGALLAGRAALARTLAFATYALVSRPAELPAVAAMALAAEGTGALAGHALARATGAPRLAWSVVLGASTLFALLFLTRMGVQCGLNFTTMDFTAGTFGSSVNPPSRIAVCLVVKYVAAFALVGGAWLRWLPSAARRPVLQLFAVGIVLRFATMAAILFAPTVSFWSRYRMVGELAPVLVLGLMAGASVLWVDRPARGGARGRVGGAHGAASVPSQRSMAPPRASRSPRSASLSKTSSKSTVPYSCTSMLRKPERPATRAASSGEITARAASCGMISP